MRSSCIGYKITSPGLEADNQFKGIEKLVDEPNVLFAYLDAKSGFERFYEASRPMLAFGIVLMPTLSRYVDAMALPETDEISKYLSPIVLSRHRVANGVVDESVGPVTAYDAAALLLGGAVAMGLWSGAKQIDWLTRLKPGLYFLALSR